MEVYRKIWNIGLTLLIFLLLVLCSFLIIDIRPNIPVLKLLELLLTWPVIGGILVLIFLIKYDKSVEKLIGNSHINKIGSIEIGSNSQEARNIKADKELDLSTSTNENVDESPIFKELDTLLVAQTKMILKYIKDSGPIKDDIIRGKILVEGTIQEQANEKDAIIYVLLKFNLIKNSEFLTYEITDFGKRYLLYIGM